MTDYDMMRYFEYKHLPDTLQKVSCYFMDVAIMIKSLPDGSEKKMAFRKLLEAKDCAVRAAL